MSNNLLRTLIVAVIAAFIVFSACLIMGYSFWVAFGMYSLTGALILIIPTLLAEWLDDKRP